MLLQKAEKLGRGLIHIGVVPSAQPVVYNYLPLPHQHLIVLLLRAVSVHSTPNIRGYLGSWSVYDEQQ